MSNTHTQPGPAPYPGMPAPAPSGSNGLATAGFVLGLLGLLGCWIPVLNIVAIILAVLGVVLAGVGLAKSKRAGAGRGLAIAGLVLGVLAVIFAIIINVAFVGAVDDAVNSASDDAPRSTVDSSGKSQRGSESSDANDGPSFVNGVLTTDDVRIKITKHEVIQAGRPGNQYGDKPIVNFTYDTTNVSGSQTDPSSAWIFAINAFQDNDPNSENELDLAITLESPYSDTSNENIKKGGTVTNDMAYELDDLSTPVDLVASDLLGLDDLGTVSYKLK